MSTAVTLPSTHLRHREVDWRVKYEYAPSERETRTGPRCDAHIEICEIYTLHGLDDLRDFFSEAILSEMEQKLLRQLEES